MLHIILTILKILGILLLVLLGIVLAVLFVPFCYSAWGKKEGKELSARATASWLFHLIHVRMIYAEKKTEFEVFLLGIPLMAVKRKLDGWKEKRRSKKAATVKKDTVAVQKNVSDEVEQNKRIQKSQKMQDDAPQLSTTKQDIAESGVSKGSKPDISQPTASQKSTQEPEFSPKAKEGIWIKIKKVFLNILHFPSACLAKLRKIRLTFQGFCDKMKEWRAFIKKDSTKQAIRFILTRTKGLLRHILPRKIRGNITFGFDDPALTGQILGVVGMFYPLYKNKFQMTPVFDQAVLEGELRLKGRIFVCYLLWIAWKVWINKDVKVTYQRFQHKEA